MIDLLAHAGFTAALYARKRRAGSAAVQKVLAGQKELPRRVLQGLLDKFVGAGLEAFDNAEELQIPPFDAMGTPVELMKAFGGRAGFEKALGALEAALYGEG